MKFFSISTILVLSASAFAASVSVPSDASKKWISVETGVTEAGNVTAVEKRAGTEVVTCYNTGTKADRAPIISVIDDWCNNVAIGKRVANGQQIWARYNYGTFTVLVSAKAINGGNWVVDNNCNRLLRLPVDKCNTGGVNGKQGGYETDLFGQWNLDPGSNGSDF